VVRWLTGWATSRSSWPVACCVPQDSAVRAYLAADSPQRRVEAFAVFNIFYQAGIFAGPLVGLALMAFDFRVTAAAAAAVFAVLTIAQLFALPQQGPAPVKEKTSLLADWRTVAANRPFLLFATAMIGSYVLLFQVYPALPLHAKALAPHNESVLLAAIFVISGVVAVGGQLKITRWFAQRWGAGKSLAIGLAVQAVSFVPLMVLPDDHRAGQVAAVAALLVTAAALAVGSVSVFPFEMDAVVALANNRLIGTHYGFYNTIVGVGILIGNLLTGSFMQAAIDAGRPELTWAALMAIGLLSAGALHRLDPTARLRADLQQGVVKAR